MNEGTLTELPGIPQECRTIVVADDDPSMRAALTETVRRLGFDVQVANDGQDALELALKTKPWLVLTDLKMPRLGGLDLVNELSRRLPAAHIVLMTAYGTVETAVEAMKHGASDYVLKPFSTDLLERIIGNLQSARENVPTSSAVSAGQRAILSQDPGMVRLLSTIEGVAASQATIMISGESGTGKELLARFIHSRSPRAHRPFVAVNCAALPDGLLESELFGYERGAFTGAVVRKQGKFEMAHTGTLLLDEISEMNLGLQAKLLRVLQEREVDRVGGREPVSVNIRVIATTNRLLHKEVEAGRFREDLFYRLNVFPITVPPLRERPTDIPLLARHFAKAASARNGLSFSSLSDGALARLHQHSWKGNVRELENVMERAVLLAGGTAIAPEHIAVDTQNSPALPGARPADETVPSGAGNGSGNGSLWEMERELIFQTLARTKENRTHAARELGISIRTLRNKLREYRQQDGALIADV
ncbi:Acetoacetate metabolism regulatory protein AtoC [Nitrospira sp. KM1]|uniref:sigma-54-dependent transcriptional regulator n=1 Tax=Nitrospira sp. KM1 TaxID=1936990 RepID=UPI0013A77304|nr:sigma-54 dependent transcriptional regulator [Nitrospira sp. KM1]BCA54822.1 Acetoacetate metabolism regulatory protein AtoC [Nitrospira sp. KM1]